MITTRIYPAQYKGKRSIIAENEVIRTELLPELGGKIVSLLYKPSGKEWMIDSGSRPLRQPEFGSVFTDWDMSGWDECFPTIDACRLGAEEGISIPDHGEIWSLPWDCWIEGPQIRCSVEGRQLPYRFERQLEIMDGDTVRLAYSVENIGYSAMPFLWTAHPQFQVDEPTQIVLPAGMKSLLCVFGGHSLETGSEFYPPAEWIIGPAPNKDGRKFYYPSALNSAWSGLIGRDTGNYLLLITDPAKSPYWGVWIDQGMCNDRTVIALEPGIGYYDALDRAVANGTAVMLKPGEVYRWQLNVVLGSGDWESSLQRNHPFGILR